MEIGREREIDHRGRKDIYEYVERVGETTEREVRAAVGMGQREFGHHVTILERDGVIERSDGQIRVAYDAGETERFESNGTEVTVRPAHQGDISGLVGVMRATVDEGRYAVAETVAQLIDREGVVLRDNELEARMFFVACVEGDVVGWVHLAHPRAAKLEHTAQLTLGTLAEYRELGIGSRLLERGTEWAAEQEFEKLYNSVPATNDRAISFLETRGWEITARREDHYRIDGEYVDEVMMAARL